MRTNYLSQKETKINDFILTNQGKFKEHDNVKDVKHVFMKEREKLLKHL